MAYWRKAILFGALIWVIAFAGAFAIFPLRQSARPVFESIMPLLLVGATAFFGIRYLNQVQGDTKREGLRLGLLWLAINVGIDLPLMLSPSPMQMSLGDYFGDIGLTYLIIPLVTSALGVAMSRSVKATVDEPT